MDCTLPAVRLWDLVMSQPGLPPREAGSAGLASVTLQPSLELNGSIPLRHLLLLGVCQEPCSKGGGGTGPALLPLRPLFTKLSDGQTPLSWQGATRSLDGWLLNQLWPARPSPEMQSFLPLDFPLLPCSPQTKSSPDTLWNPKAPGPDGWDTLVNSKRR